MDHLIAQRSCTPQRTPDGWACARWSAAPGEWFCGVCGQPLPPVKLSLDPPRGRSGRDGEARKVAVVCERTAQTRDEDLKDKAYVLAISITDPHESGDVQDLPLDPGEASAQMGLDLGRPVGEGPFDIVVELRNKRRDKVATEPLVVGSYDYPTPIAAFDGERTIELPLQPGPFGLRLILDPANATIEAARLDIQGVGSVSATSAGEQLIFDPGQQVWDLLKLIEGTRPAALELTFRGAEKTVVLDRIEVQRLTPPRLGLVLPARSRALAGRRARIPSRLANAGGSPALIREARWTLTDVKGAVVAEGAIAALADLRIESQEALDDELRLELAGTGGKAPSPGLYRLKVDIAYEDPSRPGASPAVGRDIDIELKAEAPYGGLVCIDFGTTDTAASLIPPGETYFEDPTLGQTPKLIELGRIAPPVDGAQPRYFLPTRAAVGLDADGGLIILYADEAVKGVQSLNHGRLIDRLKWRLGKNEPIEGFDGRVAIKDLAAGYLEHVRRLIEDHPDVAARVETVVATRPARFGGGRDQALIDAYLAAGMTVDAERFGERARPMVSESWPPVLFMVPMPEPAGPPSRRLLASLFDLFPAEEPPSQFDVDALEAAPSYLCTFDIGGGSTDVSLLELKLKDGRIQVSDLETFTDHAFAGEWFRDLIVEELRVATRNLAPGSDIPCNEGEGPGWANLEELRRIAGAIQHFPSGPFRELRTPAEALLQELAAMDPPHRQAVYGMVDPDPSRARRAVQTPEALAFVANATDECRTYLDPSYRLTARLLRASGALFELVLTANPKANEGDLPELLGRVLIRFAENYAPSMDRIIGKIAETVRNRDGLGRVRVLMTGRGSLFRLAESLIRPRVTQQLQVAAGDIYLGAGESAKAVTSWGGAGLKAARTVAGDLEFAGLEGEGYALYARSPVMGTTARLQLERLQPDAGELWGAPLAQLHDGFLNPRILRVGLDLGEGAEPDELARLTGFNLTAERRARPGGWVVFDPARKVIELQDDAPGMAADGEQGDAP